MTGEREKAAFVHSMFVRIAHRYDLANHLLSLNLDRYWRARTVRRVREILRKPRARVLDLCCGTGDLLLAMEASSRAPVMGTDFCYPMLVRAKRKSASCLFESDALQLPLPDASLDLITVAFGFRNLASYEKGLAEMRRVMRAGGMAAILEFSQPTNAMFAALYDFYSRKVLPVIGGALSGAKDVYAYLPESVSQFPSAQELAEMMRRAGFDEVGFERMSGGIVALHLGKALV